jgi:formate-dependent nitrite reductase cytochrome c552 subunit
MFNMGTRTAVPEELKAEILTRSNNRCCVCQTPFVQLHHIDEDPSNNDIDNIAPLCPNCHTQAHSKSMLTTNLTATRVKVLRDRWYSYCEKRKEGSNIGANALLKLKNLVHSLGSADYSWKRMFATLDPNYEEMSREDIINRVFSTSNRDDLVAALETVKNMYGSQLSDPRLLQKFQAVCNAFGIGYDELL